VVYPRETHMLVPPTLRESETGWVIARSTTTRFDPDKNRIIYLIRLTVVKLTISIYLTMISFAGENFPPDSTSKSTFFEIYF